MRYSSSGERVPARSSIRTRRRSDEEVNKVKHIYRMC